MNVEMNYAHVNVQQFNESGIYGDYRTEDHFAETINMPSAKQFEEFPMSARPVPSSFANIFSHQALLDPRLCITPEKSTPTLVKLSGGEDIDDVNTNLRQTRVHFDQTVSVHHLSPEVSTDISSVINSSEEINSSISTETASPDSLSVSSFTISSGEEEKQQNKLLLNEDIPRCTLNSFNLQDSDLDLSFATSTDSEPISVVASDLRHLKLTASDCLLKNPIANCTSSNKKQRSCDVKKTNQILLRGDCIRERNILKSPESNPNLAFVNSKDGILSRPELNSTLRLTKEIAELKAKEFDKREILKGNLDPKLKEKIEEKALAKLNAASTVYTNLLSLEVQEDELLNRVAEAKLAKVRPENGDRVKTEDMVSRAPDIMEFFTNDLQPELPSFTLFGIIQDRTELQTVDLDCAFDIYKHTRVWDRFF